MTVNDKKYLFVSLCFLMCILLMCSLAVVNSQTIRQDLKEHHNWKLLDRGDDCGQSISDRIIGGKKAPLGKYPWLVRLLYSFMNLDNCAEEIYDCGGTLISERYILTAAHCSPEQVNMNLIKVRVGEHQVSSDKDCQNGSCAPTVQDLHVESYVCHENYNEETFHDDICLVRTTQPIEFNNYAHPICLPSYDIFHGQNFDNVLMEVAGWGIDNVHTGTSSDILEFITIPIVPLEICKDSYIDVIAITQKQMCAGGIIGKDSCNGDSGGPIMKVFSTGAPPRYFVIGIVSYGPINCAETATPGVYTRVDEYMTWILDNVKE